MMDKEEKKAYNKAYREANKEKILKQKKAYHEANKEKIAEFQKAYREANKEKIAERKKAYCEANKEKIAERNKVYCEANKEKVAEQKKAHYQANKEKILEQKKAHYQANKEKMLERGKVYREANKDKISDKNKTHYQANKEKIRNQHKGYEKQRYKSNPLHKLKRIYRNSCYRAFKSIGQKKNNPSLKLLGLETWQELTKHLESKFYDHPKTGEKMTFDHHGIHGWHIDHIIPLDSAKTEEDIIKLCHYTNLQPLWAEENLSKSNKILDK